MSIKSFNEYLNETSLSRIWQQFSEPTISAGIISASRAEFRPDPSANARRTMDLAIQIRQAGFGYVFADGHWVEKDAHDRDVPVEETSIIVSGTANDNGKLKGYLRRWRDIYDQESVLYKPEGSTHVFALAANGSETDIGTFRADKVADLMTRLRGRGSRSFVFEQAYVTMTWFGRLAHLAKKKL